MGFNRTGEIWNGIRQNNRKQEWNSLEQWKLGMEFIRIIENDNEIQ